MTCEFKAGDVALVDDPAYGPRVMVLIGHDPSVRCWHGQRDNGDLSCLDASQAISARPLVVIDPEDRDHAVRLMMAYDKALGDETHVKAQDDAMQAALRSFIEPPRPEEPTGLGAVVEDSLGNKWVRAPDHQWYMGEGCARWSGVDVVRIISEGVQP